MTPIITLVNWNKDVHVTTSLIRIPSFLRADLTGERGIKTLKRFKLPFPQKAREVTA